MKVQIRRGDSILTGLEREVEEHVNSHVFLQDQIELLPDRLLEALTGDKKLCFWYVVVAWMAYRGNVADVDPDFLGAKYRALYFLLAVESMRRKGYVVLRNWPLSLFGNLDGLQISKTELGERRRQELKEGPSSNGRTADLQSENEGSNPSGSTK